MLKDSAEFKELYPFESHYCRLKTGEQMHYLDECSAADRGKKEILLMLHGNPSWSFYYRKLIPEFQSNFRVIVPDHIGMGFSDKPQHYQYTLHRHIDNLQELLTEITDGTETVNLIVHDWGGAIGSGWALKNLQRVGKLIILNTGAFLSTEIPFRINICRIPGFGALAIRGLNAFAAGATVMAVEKKMPQNVKEGYLLPYNNWHNRIGTLRFVQDIPLKAEAESYKHLKMIERNLPRLQDKDILILWGGRDWCFNDSFFNGWRQRFPKAEYEYYSDGGHYILEDKGAEIISRLKIFFNLNNNVETEDITKGN